MLEGEGEDLRRLHDLGRGRQQGAVDQAKHREVGARGHGERHDRGGGGTRCGSERPEGGESVARAGALREHVAALDALNAALTQVAATG